jgi:hypothetical protein
MLVFVVGMDVCGAKSLTIPVSWGKLSIRLVVSVACCTDRNSDGRASKRTWKSRFEITATFHAETWMAPTSF